MFHIDQQLAQPMPNHDSTRPTTLNAETTARNGPQALPGELWLPGFSPIPCQIAKLAPNQLIFISLSNLHQTPATGCNGCSAQLVIDTGEHADPLWIGVTVNHHTRERWVLEPEQRSRALLADLKALLLQPPAPLTPGDRHLSAHQRARLIDHCQRNIAHYLERCFTHFHSMLDDELLRTAAEPDQAETCLATMALLASNPAALENDLKQRVLKQIAESTHPGCPAGAPAFSEPVVADHHDHHHPVGGKSANQLIQPLANRAASHHHVALQRLAFRYSLVARTLTTPPALPFGPHWLARHFSDSLKAHQFPSTMVPMLHQVFANIVLQDLDLLFSKLELALNINHDLSWQEEPASSSGHRASRNPLCPAEQHSIGLLAASYGLRLAHRQDATAASSPDAADAQLFDRLFEQVITDPHIEDEARQLLRQIKAPLIAVAGSDINFFQAADNAPRRCFNLIAQLCRKAHYRSVPLKRRLSSICERIARESRVNHDIFATVSPLLEQLMNRQRQAAQRNVERLAAGCEGQYRLRQAKTTVDNELRQRLGSAELPIDMVTLVDNGWHRHLVQSLLSDGPRGQAYQDGLATLDQLHAALTTAETGTCANGIAPNLTTIEIAQLGERLLHPLGTIGLADVPSLGAVERLKATLQSGPPADPPSPAARARPSSMAQQLTSDTKYVSSPPDNNLGIEAGEWLGWIDNPGEQAVQLAWAAPDASQFVFADEMGQQLFELNAGELAFDRAHGLQRMVAPWHWPPLEDSLYRLLSEGYANAASAFSRDTTTGLLDANALESRLAELIKFAYYSNGTHTLIGLRLNHESVDLVAVATLVGDHCTDPQLGARMDNNTFAVVLPYTDANAAESTLAALRGDLKALLQQQDADPPMFHSALEVVDQYCGNPSLALRRLEQALDAGTTQTPPATSLRWLTDLGAIVRQQRLTLRVQIMAAMGAVDDSHTEILLGVRDEHGAVQLPGELLAGAEQHQRTDIIDRWIIQQTFQWLRDHPDKSQSLGCAHINLSSSALRSQPLLRLLRNELESVPLPNGALCFELSETTALAHLPVVADFIARVRAYGCLFALDNVGRSDQSLTLLRQLPIDMIKIDPAYSTRLPHDSASEALLQSLALAARSLGIKVAAQGVESEAALLSLERLGVDYAQGYAVSKPMLLSEI